MRSLALNEISSGHSDGQGGSARSMVACAVLAVVSALFAVIASAADSAAPLRVQLRWMHQAQFAGYYVAEAHALQRQHGIRTAELLEGGPGIDPLERLGKGEVDVAIGWLGDALDARSKGADIVNVAQIFRRPGMALACPVST